jgi:hypothetical protein
MINFTFSWNAEQDMFTHEPTGYMLSREYVKSATNEEVIARVFDNTGDTISDELVNMLRDGYDPHPPVVEEVVEEVHRGFSAGI